MVQIRYHSRTQNSKKDTQSSVLFCYSLGAAVDFGLRHVLRQPPVATEGVGECR